MMALTTWHVAECERRATHTSARPCAQRMLRGLRRILPNRMSSTVTSQQISLWKAQRTVNSSCERNKVPISQTLTKALFKRRSELKFADRKALSVIEIASGTGQHAACIGEELQAAFKDVKLSWQPTDVTDTHFSSIKAWAGLHGVRGSVKDPVIIDASTDWAKDALKVAPDGAFDVVYCSNCIHITPWDVGKGILRGAGGVLRDNGVLILYGPFGQDGKLTPQSNVDFDAWLKRKNPSFGVRDIADVTKEASKNGFKLSDMLPMPANNFLVILEKAAA